MFLKTESFEHNGVTVTLSELSALQRIEHLALMKRQAEQAESDSNRKFTVEDAIRTGAFVVAMSLWHNHPCVFRSIRSRIGIEVRSAIRIHSINRELNFFYRFLTRFFAAFHYRGIFPQ